MALGVSVCAYDFFISSHIHPALRDVDMHSMCHDVAGGLPASVGPRLCRMLYSDFGKQPFHALGCIIGPPSLQYKYTTVVMSSFDRRALLFAVAVLLFFVLAGALQASMADGAVYCY